MKKGILFISLLVMIVLIAGCTGFNNPIATPTPTPTVTPTPTPAATSNPTFTPLPTAVHIDTGVTQQTSIAIGRYVQTNYGLGEDAYVRDVTYKSSNYGMYQYTFTYKGTMHLANITWTGDKFVVVDVDGGLW